MPKAHSGEKSASSTNRAKQTGGHSKKKKTGCLALIQCKISPGWITDINVKPEMFESDEGKQGKHFKI